MWVPDWNDPYWGSDDFWATVPEDQRFVGPGPTIDSPGSVPVYSPPPPPQQQPVYNYEEDPETRRLRERLDFEREMREQERRERETRERETAQAFLTGILEQYGMGSLASQVADLVGQWGSNIEVITERLRQTEEYKTRFKGLVGLRNMGVTDITNEGDYIRFESEYRNVFREAGLRDFLGASGSQQEIDSIADLITKYSVSVNEVRARVADAQRVAAQTPAEVRDALQRFYGVGAQDLVAYSLDPQRTMTRINEMANAAILGGFATRAGLDVGVGAAERLVGGVGDQDIDIESVQREMAQAREIRDATRRLAEIESGTLRDEEVLEARAGTDVGAAERIRGLQSRERARFGGSTAVGATTLSRSSRI